MTRFTVGTYSVDLNCYQWGYRSGTAYLERPVGVSAGGVQFRQKTETSQRLLTATFAQDEVSMALLRDLGIYAARTGQRVQFFPDTLDLGTFRWLDWPPELRVQHSVEGRLMLEIPLVEQPS